MVSAFYSINPTHSFKDWETDDTTPTRRQIKIFASFFLLDGGGVISRQKLVKHASKQYQSLCVRLFRRRVRANQRPRATKD